MTPLLVIILMTSELPDPGKPVFTSICAGFGGFFAAVAGYLRGRSREHVRQLATEGSIAGFGVGLVGWIVALAIDRL